MWEEYLSSAGDFLGGNQQTVTTTTEAPQPVNPAIVILGVAIVFGLIYAIIKFK